MQLGIGGAYGHKLIKIFMYALVWWDGVVQSDVVCGGSYGELYWRWENREDHYFLINCPITDARWMHIKICKNLKKHGASPKRG